MSILKSLISEYTSQLAIIDFLIDCYFLSLLLFSKTCLVKGINEQDTVQHVTLCMELYKKHMSLT